MRAVSVPRPCQPNRLLRRKFWRHLLRTDAPFSYILIFSGVKNASRRHATSAKFLKEDAKNVARQGILFWWLPSFVAFHCVYCLRPPNWQLERCSVGLPFVKHFHSTLVILIWITANAQKNFKAEKTYCSDNSLKINNGTKLRTILNMWPIEFYFAWCSWRKNFHICAKKYQFDRTNFVMHICIIDLFTPLQFWTRMIFFQQIKFAQCDNKRCVFVYNYLPFFVNYTHWDCVFCGKPGRRACTQIPANKISPSSRGILCSGERVWLLKN